MQVRGDVDRLDGKVVRFVDGRTEEVDLVLYATGYDYAIPYAERHFPWRDGRPDLYLRAFSRQHRNLFGLGYLEVNSSAYTLFDQISNLLAQYLHDQDHAPDRAAAFDRLIAADDPDLSGGIRFLGTARHATYVDARTYRNYLAKVRRRMGWQDLVPGMFDALRTRGTGPSS